MEQLKLKSLFCFPLYACSKEVVRLYRPHLECLGLTYTQYIVMVVFWERGIGYVKELGEQLFLDSGTLTPVLKNLEAKGFVRRFRSEEDERVLFVELTEKGRQLKEEGIRIHGEMVKHLPLTMDESKQLYDLLNKVLDGMKE